MCKECAYTICIGNFADMPPELARCLFFLYAFFVIYLVLALYLYQVVPQTYGVAKPWNFCCKRKKKKPHQVRDTDEIGDLESERE